MGGDIDISSLKGSTLIKIYMPNEVHISQKFKPWNRASIAVFTTDYGVSKIFVADIPYATLSLSVFEGCTVASFGPLSITFPTKEKEF